jgi:hypothetical protein
LETSNRPGLRFPVLTCTSSTYPPCCFT